MNRPGLRANEAPRLQGGISIWMPFISMHRKGYTGIFNKMRKYRYVLFLLILVLPVFAATGVSAADVAVIKSNNISPYNKAVEGFVQTIGADVNEYNLEGKSAKLPGVISEINNHQPKLIFALGALAAVTAKENFPNVPIIYSLVFTPERKNLTGKNLTGIYIQASSMKQFTTLKKVVPKIRKIGVLYSYLTESLIRKAQKDCEQLDCELVPIKLRRPEDVPEGAKQLIGKVDALWLVPDSIVVNQDSLHHLLLLTLENNIPFMVYSKSFVKAGALLSPVVDYTSIGQQAGKLGQQVLQGNNPPATILPPAEIEWAINLHIARNMGIRIPKEKLNFFKYIYK